MKYANPKPHLTSKMTCVYNEAFKANALSLNLEAQEDTYTYMKTPGEYMMLFVLELSEKIK